MLPTQEKLRLRMFVGSSLVSAEEFLRVGPHVQVASPNINRDLFPLLFWLSGLQTILHGFPFLWRFGRAEAFRFAKDVKCMWNPSFACPDLSRGGVNLFDRNFRQKLVASLRPRID